jgi:hypothetical protein
MEDFAQVLDSTSPGATYEKAYANLKLLEELSRMGRVVDLRSGPPEVVSVGDSRIASY